MKKLIILTALAVFMGGCKDSSKNDISQEYFNKYIECTDEFIRAYESGQSADSLRRIDNKSEIYFNAYKRTQQP